MWQSIVRWSLSLYKLSVALFDFRQTELCTIASSSTHVVDFSIVLVWRQTLMNWISSPIPSWLHLVCRARHKKNCYFFEGVVPNWCSTVVLFNMRLACSSSPLGIWIIYIHSSSSDGGAGSFAAVPPTNVVGLSAVPHSLVCSILFPFFFFAGMRERLLHIYLSPLLNNLLTLSLPSRALKCPFLPFLSMYDERGRLSLPVVVS